MKKIMNEQHYGDDLALENLIQSASDSSIIKTRTNNIINFIGLSFNFLSQGCALSIDKQSAF